MAQIIDAKKEVAQAEKKEAQNPNIPEPVTQQALDEGRVQPNPDTAGITLDEENRLANEQKKFDEEKKQLFQSIMKSGEGYILRTEQNANQVDLLANEQDLYVNNVQSGPGGTQVEERVYLTPQGYQKAG